MSRAEVEVTLVQDTFSCPILMAADAFLRDRPDFTEEELKDGLMGNLCRCTGYYGIARAIAKARGAR